MKTQVTPSWITTTPKSVREFWSDVDQITSAVHQRAYQIFEAHNCTDGHALEDWLNAEAEILKPVTVQVTEDDKTVQVRVAAPDFTEEELQINLEPETLTIKGRHCETAGTENGTGKDLTRFVLCQVALPVSIVPGQATARLNRGAFELFAPKADAAEKITNKAA